MYYSVGEFVDLSYLNKKVVEQPVAKPSVFSQAVESGQAVGTQVLFRLENNKLVGARRIPVQFA